MLLDVALVDVNNDGYDDIIGGYDGDVTSPIFLNDNGTFNKDNIITLPNSYYGAGNQMHMKTMPADFDKDGDIDLAILWTTANPVYAGNYIQINLNDGKKRKFLYFQSDYTIMQTGGKIFEPDS